MKLPAKFLFLITALLIAIVSAVGQDLSKVEQQFYTAYITNSSTAWKVTLQQLEQSEDEPTQLLLAKGYYAAAGTAMGNQDEDLAGDLLDKAAILTKKLLKKNSELAEANALLSSVYGMKIGLSPIKGMLLGSKSNNAAQKGIDLAPDNEFTNFVKGNNLFYTPATFGGDLKKSLDFLEKAKSIFEKKERTNTWEYMTTMALLGQAYHKLKNYDKAESIYNAALEIAPNFGYVKYYLLPATKKAKS